MNESMEQPSFHYISGPDDFLVNRLAAQRWSELSAEAQDDFSLEVINGHAGKVDEVEAAVNSFRSAAQTLGLFGGRRFIWLKGITFMADNQTGRAEGTQRACEDLQEILESIRPEEVGVLLSASPVDRRKRFSKWLEKNGVYEAAGGMDSSGKGAEALAILLKAECAELDVTIGSQAIERLISKVDGNSRLLVEEASKLASYLGEPGTEITSELIDALTPQFGGGDFFETTEAFFSRNLSWTLDALRRHFFAGNDARPVISSLQNRNRLLIQLRSLLDGGEISFSGGSIAKGAFERAAAKYAAFYDGLDAKSGFNVFTQNLWYMGKLLGQGELPSLKALIDHQLAFIEAFREIIDRPGEQEEALRGVAIRCLN